MGNAHDCEAIRQCLATYARGVDRHDRDTILSSYWPDGWDDHVQFSGNPSDFADWVLDLLRDEISAFHFLGQSLIKLTGSKASVETYFLAKRYLETPEGLIARESIGRYLDVFEKRGDEWRVLTRDVLLDGMSEVSAPTMMRFSGTVSERRWPADRSYALFPASSTKNSAPSTG